MNELKIEMGAMAPDMVDQLKPHGVHEKTASYFEMDSQAITRLVIRGHITPSVAERARQRLFKEIKAEVTSCSMKGEKQNG